MARREDCAALADSQQLRGLRHGGGTTVHRFTAAHPLAASQQAWGGWGGCGTGDSMRPLAALRAGRGWLAWGKPCIASHARLPLPPCSPSLRATPVGGASVEEAAHALATVQPLAALQHPWQGKGEEARGRARVGLQLCITCRSQRLRGYGQAAAWRRAFIALQPCIPSLLCNPCREDEEGWRGENPASLCMRAYPCNHAVPCCSQHPWWSSVGNAMHGFATVRPLAARNACGVAGGCSMEKTMHRFAAVPPLAALQPLQGG